MKLPSNYRLSAISWANHVEPYDVIVIGGGIIGASVLYELAQYQLKLLLLEKNPILADETTCGNSGVIHGGFDPEPHKLMAQMNVMGNHLWVTKWFQHLNFPHKQVDSLVLAFSEHEMEHIKMLYQRGLTNHVPAEHLQVLSGEAILKKAPHVNSSVFGGLLCTNSWVIDPVRATYCLVGASEQNGAHVALSAAVTQIEYHNDLFKITLSDQRVVYSKLVINAAGHYADELAALANYPDFKQTTRRGEYRILARSQASLVHHVYFKVPTIHGKGVIVAPRLDGRVLVGPTAENDVPKANTRLISEKQYQHIGKIGHSIIPTLDLEQTEMSLAGSRPIEITTDDFYIQPAKNNPKFINVAGMQSPGISSAPAIAQLVAQLVSAAGVKLVKNPNFNPNYHVQF